MGPVERRDVTIVDTNVDPRLAEVTQVTILEQLNDRKFLEELIAQGRIVSHEFGQQGWAADMRPVCRVTISPISEQHYSRNEEDNPYDRSIICVIVDGKKYPCTTFVVDEEIGTFIRGMLRRRRLLKPFKEFASGLKDGLRSAFRG